ncbi:MAG: 30S ribosome-binding factor RbfA [Rickettsiales bacterium]|jgi:ribosome-binding factor A|nr:30S ribosome-binding factor RbfA [Rickettsiales bacterium]
MTNPRFKEKKKFASNRQLKVAESVKRSISEILNSDKVLEFVTGDQTYTISKVDISPDLKNAKVYVIPFGSSDSSEQIKLLNDNSSVVKKSLIHKMVLKYTPDIKFIYDHSFEAAARVTDLIDNI